MSAANFNIIDVKSSCGIFTYPDSALPHSELFMWEGLMMLGAAALMSAQCCYQNNYYAMM